MKKVNIKDVAKALNVSISTISRAFNDRYDINPETRKMILEKAEELGYSPNSGARQMALRKSFTIGVVVPEFLNSFFPEVIMGVQKVANKEGFQVLIMSSQESAEMERRNIEMLMRQGVDGILLSLPLGTRDVSFHKQVLEEGLPIVQFNRVNPKLPTPKVIFEDYRWAMEATEHLISNGYRKIYCLGGPINMVVAHNRVKGFKDAIAKHKLTYNPQDWVIETGMFFEDGRRIAEQLIDNYDVPEALFCFNDPVAIGAMETLQEQGYNIPDDVALVGFSESRIAIHTVPRLTSVKQPTYEMGEKAAQMLIEMIKGQRLGEKTIMLTGSLNIRESSAPKQQKDL